MLISKRDIEYPILFTGEMVRQIMAGRVAFKIEEVA